MRVFFIFLSLRTLTMPEVSLEFNEEGKQLFAAITSRNVSKLMAIFLDGEPISVPRVQNAITDGRAVITGNFTIKEGKLLAQRLNAGALPVPIALISQQTVGASLGSASIAASLKAGLIGFALVAFFMLVYYRFAGLIAVFALCIYAAIVLALFKLIPVTLTLSGIGGVIFSVGVVVSLFSAITVTRVFLRIAALHVKGKGWYGTKVTSHASRNT